MPRSLATRTSSRVLIIATSVVMVFLLAGAMFNTSAATSNVTATIGSGADDARSPESGAFTASERTTLIGAGNGRQANVAGFRFNGIGIPKGSVITGVEFSMVKDGSHWQRIVVECAFEATDNAAPFSASAAPANRVLTNNRLRADNNVKRNANERAAICDGGNLVNALQEVVDRAGWKSGNSLALIATGPASPAWARLHFFMSEAGASRAPQLKVSFTPPSGVPPTNTPAPTNTPDPTVPATPTTPPATPTTPAATPTTPPSTPGEGFGRVNLCGEGTTSWHPPMVNGCQTTHEHGDAPPQWVMNAGYSPSFEHHANTPRENALKHTSFKGYSGRMNGFDVYVVMHLDTTPNGHTSRFHSYQMWARDLQGGVSHWHGWLDFGVGDMAGPQVRRIGCEDTSVRPIFAVNDEDCGRMEFESWYSRASGSGPWAPDFGFNTKAQYFTGGDVNDETSWNGTGQLNDVRRMEVAWYADRTPLRGTFWATQWGQVVSGPNDAVCGTTRTIGGKSYPVLCLQQYIAPTMTSLVFPGNSFQKNYPMNGVSLPN